MVDTREREMDKDREDEDLGGMGYYDGAVWVRARVLPAQQVNARHPGRKLPSAWDRHDGPVWVFLCCGCILQAVRRKDLLSLSP